MAINTTTGIYTIRRETVVFLKTTLQKYCEENRIRIQTLSTTRGPGFPTRQTPTNELHCVLLGKERCSWQYPKLGEKGHFYSGVMMVVREAPDEHGPNYVELVFAPEHGDPQATNSFPAIDLTRIQEELAVQEKRPGIIDFIQKKLRLGIEVEDSILEQYKEK